MVSINKGNILAILLCLAAIVFGVGGFMYVTSGDTPQPTFIEPASIDGSSSQTVNTTEAALDGVVSIHVKQDGQPTSQGSGFMYTENHIITNHHVIEGGDTFYVRYREGEWTKATLVGADVYTDIAVLEPEEKPEYAKPLPLREEPPARGTSVIALGAPSNLQGTVTHGVVSGTGRSMQTAKGFGIPDTIQTDAALNPGNSGGPLIATEDSAVVGVNRARDGENIGFAISTRLADRVAQSLIEDGDHQHPYVGIRTVGLSPMVDGYDSVETDQGLIVTDVVEGTPAYESLETAENTSKHEIDVENSDIMLSIDGHELTSNEELANYLMRNKSPGDDVEVTVLRDGEKQTVTFELGTRPNPFEDE